MAVLLCCYKLSSLSSEVHAMAGHLPDSARYRTEQVEELKVDWLFLKNSKDSSVSQSIPWLSASLGCLWWSLSYNVYFKVSVYDFPCDFSGTYISFLHIYLLTLPEMGWGCERMARDSLSGCQGEWSARSWLEKAFRHLTSPLPSWVSDHSSPQNSMFHSSFF